MPKQQRKDWERIFEDHFCHHARSYFSMRYNVKVLCFSCAYTQTTFGTIEQNTC